MNCAYPVFTQSGLVFRFSQNPGSSLIGDRLALMAVPPID